MKDSIKFILGMLLIGVITAQAQTTTQTSNVETTRDKVQSLIERLQLQPHIEGGFFKETYKNNLSVMTPWHEKRPLNTLIYYLLRSQDFSRFHRLKSDEIWHFYSGTSATIYDIDEDGKLHTTILGDPTLDKDAIPQVVIPKNTWFAAKVNTANSFILVGCTVSPGFDYHDFEVGQRQALLDQYPQYQTIINELSVN